MQLVDWLGILAALLTAMSYLPQVIKSLRTRTTRDISLGMYSVLISGLLLWLVYGLLIGNIPLIFANIIAVAMSGIVLCLKIRHG